MLFPACFKFCLCHVARASQGTRISGTDITTSLHLGHFGIEGVGLSLNRWWCSPLHLSSSQAKQVLEVEIFLKRSLFFSPHQITTCQAKLCEASKLNSTGNLYLKTFQYLGWPILWHLICELWLLRPYRYFSGKSFEDVEKYIFHLNDLNLYCD